jgi:hypothetical protein
VEAEGCVIEAIIHVLNKTGISVTNLLETIKMAEKNDESRLCLDPSLLNIQSAYRNSVDTDLEVIFIFIVCCKLVRPPLWSNNQSFWLVTQRSRVRLPALPNVGLEWGPLSPCEGK